MPRSEAGGRDLRLGLDVGGTNTDGVIIDAADRLVARVKRPTTPEVTDGLRATIRGLLEELSPGDVPRIGRVMLGTTHATNAVLERRGLGRVAVLRLGAPATTSVAPLADWPADLRDVVAHDPVILPGGHYLDGRSIGRFDPAQVRAVLGRAAGRVDAVAVTSVFSPAAPDQEREVAELAAEVLGPEVRVSMSHEVGTLGLRDRESATVLNAALAGVAGQVVAGLDEVLRAEQLDAETLFAQNDGTLMSLAFAQRYPVRTIGSGPANSLRGAAALSGLRDAIVADVGGTSTDLGVLLAGFPRESAAAVELGGVRTNLRMPDVLSLAIGGGTVVAGGEVRPKLGPRSVGHRLVTEALVFGGTVPTLTDAVVHAGRGRLGDATRTRAHGPLLAAALTAVDARLADAVDQVALGRHDLPVVVVGGAAFLVPDHLPGVASVHHPDDGDVANAIGAAIAWISGRWDGVVATGDGYRDQLLAARESACERAVAAGADAAGVEVVDQTEVPLSYLPSPAVRIQITAAGPPAPP